MYSGLRVGKSGLGLFDRTVNPGFDSFTNRAFNVRHHPHFASQNGYPLFPSIQLDVGKRRIQDDLRSLFTALGFAGTPLRLSGFNEFFLCGIENQRLRVHIEKSRRRAFKAERESIGVTHVGADRELRHIAVASFEIGLIGADFVSSTQRHLAAMGHR